MDLVIKSSGGQINFGNNSNYCINKVDWGTADLTFTTEKLMVGEHYMTSNMKGRKIVITFYVFANANDSTMAINKHNISNILRPFEEVTLTNSITIDVGANNPTWHIEGYIQQSIKWSVEYKDNNNSVTKGQVTIFCPDPYFKRTIYPSVPSSSTYDSQFDYFEGTQRTLAGYHVTSVTTTYGSRYSLYNKSERKEYCPLLMWKWNGSTMGSIGTLRLYQGTTKVMDASMRDPISSSTWHLANIYKNDIIVVDPNRCVVAIYSSYGARTFDFTPYLNSNYHSFPGFTGTTNPQNFSLFVGTSSGGSLSDSLTWVSNAEALAAYGVAAIEPTSLTV